VSGPNFPAARIYAAVMLDETVPHDPGQPARPPARRPLPSLSRPAGPAGLAALAIVALALAVRLIGLGQPGGMLVDERYYVGGARFLIAQGWEPTTAHPVPGALPAVHPPLGKWLIGFGIWLAGDRPFGWRLASAFIGAATVGLVYLCGRRLFPGRAAPALIAALLLAVEDLSVVQSRTAMLDVFVTFWIVAGFLALLRDRDQRAGVRPGAGAGSRLWAGRRWRLLAGMLFGCALATKWTVVYVLPLAAVLVVWWEVRRRRESAELKPALTRAIWDEGTTVILSFAFVPVAVYVASYLGAFTAGGTSPLAWWQDQIRVLAFHTSLTADHPYASSALSWLADRRAVSYFYSQPPVPGAAGPVPGAREVLALGHPLVFLGIVPVWLWAGWRAVRRREAALAAPLLFGLALWLPWVVQPERTMFLFYMTPVVPFVVLLQGAALGRLLTSGAAGAVLGGVVLAAVAALFWFHWPVLVGQAITQEAWQLRVPDWSKILLWRPHWV
jgi:dolichyl-phosphate-mannose--protein O-mannosyl transferase